MNNPAAILQQLFDNLDRASSLVDAGALEKASALLARHDAMVRQHFFTPDLRDQSRWLELLRRQRELTLKFTSLRDEIGNRIAGMSRGRAVAREYLATPFA